MNIILSLVSGLVGSLIGATVTFLVSRDSMHKSFEKALVLDKKKRQKDAKEQTAIALNALDSEIKENLKSVDIWYTFGGKFKFNVYAWDSNKAFMDVFEKSIQESLLDTYSKIRRFNTLIEYDFRTPHGLGSKDKEIERQISEVKLSLDLLTKAIKNSSPKS